MAKITLTIDGKKVEAEQGMTIFQAAKSAGIEIPHLCYHEALPPIGSCRMCLVEVEGARGFVTSCASLASDGMVVKTQTEQLENARKMIIELLLSDHPLDCMTCEKAGNCRLQDYAYKYGLSQIRFEGKRHEYPVDTSNPFIVRDLNKCILCGRCVSACNNVQVSEVLEFSQRGFASKLVADNDKPLQDSTCVFCGRCVSVCPVGALIEKQGIGKGREWEIKKVKTICNYCGCGCTIVLNIRDGKIVKVTSTEDSPVAHGSLCVKGRFGWDFIHSPDRLTKPLIKKDGKFEEASWDEALNLVASKFSEIKSKYGGEGLAVLSSAKCSNEENYLMQKFARAVLGTKNIDHCARLCHASTVAGLAISFGSGAMTNSIDEIEKAEMILVIGSNTTEAHPVIGSAIKRAVKLNNAKLVTIDPRKIELAEWSTIHLSPRFGTDVACLNGLMNVIISENLHDKKFIEERTEGFDELKKTVEKYTPEYVENITGVPADDLRKAARMYATTEKAMIFYTMGITQHTTGTDNVMSIANLAMLTGHVGKESTGVNPLRGQSNVQGACDMGCLPNSYPGYQRTTDENVKAKFEKAWNVSLPDGIGLTVVEIIHAVHEGKIKGLYIMGENPALSDPDVNFVREALENIEFLVVQDLFLSETAEFADVVLPAAAFAEKEGSLTNTERRVQLLHKAIDPPGEARADWEIICDLSSRMGYEMKYSSPAQIMEEISSLTPIYGGMSYERLEGNGLQWPCPDKSHPGTKFLHKDKFTRGLGKFSAIEFRPPFELPDDEYPLVLSTGRILYHFHTGTLSRRSEGINELVPEGTVDINPVDAEKLGLTDGDMVKVSSRRGAVTAKVKVTRKSQQGTVFMTFHFKEAAANLLTVSALDPIAKIPEFKVCAVRIDPVGVLV